MPALGPSSDPFLFAHRLSGKLYNISSGLGPISVRDQMVRSQLLVNRLLLTGTLRADQRLLVVGGGVAGFTAASTAARQGIETVLLEGTGELFSCFAGCDTRWVYSHLYEWPAPHWTERDYHEVPLSWSSGVASGLVPGWREQADQIQEELSPRLSVRLATPLSPQDLIQLLTRPQPPYAIRAVLPGSEPEVEQFEVAVLALGSPEEDTRLGAYQGPQFWECDQFHLPRLGLPTQPSVLISGAGDSALQDYIPIVTGKQTHEVIERIEEIFQDDPLWIETKARLLYAQTQAEHLYHWGRSGEQYAQTDAEICQHLGQAFENQVEQLMMKRPEKWQTLRTQLQEWRPDDELPRKLRLVYRRPAFSWCYALNRFLVLALSKCLVYRLRSSLQPNKVCGPVICDHNPGEGVLHPCHGKEHTTFIYRTGEDPRQLPGGATGRGQAHFEVLISRRGTGDPLFESFKPSHERQILPRHTHPGKLFFL
jgi:hypothetical protein